MAPPGADAPIAPPTNLDHELSRRMPLLCSVPCKCMYDGKRRLLCPSARLLETMKRRCGS